MLTGTQVASSLHTGRNSALLWFRKSFCGPEPVVTRTADPVCRLWGNDNALSMPQPRSGSSVWLHREQPSWNPGPSRSGLRVPVVNRLRPATGSAGRLGIAGMQPAVRVPPGCPGSYAPKAGAPANPAGSAASSSPLTTGILSLRTFLRAGPGPGKHCPGRVSSLVDDSRRRFV